MLPLALIDLLGTPFLLAFQVVLLAWKMPREATFREKIEVLKEPISVVLGNASLIFICFVGYAVKPSNGWLILIIPLTFSLFIGALTSSLDAIGDFREVLKERHNAAARIEAKEAAEEARRRAALRADEEKRAQRQAREDELNMLARQAAFARCESDLLDQWASYRLTVDFTGKQPITPIIDAFRRSLLTNPPSYLAELRQSQHPTIRAIIGNGAGWPPA